MAQESGDGSKSGLTMGDDSSMPHTEGGAGLDLDLTAEVGRPRTPVAAAPSVNLARGVSVGRYVVLDVLGEGGMGVVHAAYDPELDRKVALKLLQPSVTGDANVRLLREAQAMARLSHPNVLPVHDVGTFEGRVFITLELVDGETLGEWCRAQPRSWQDVVERYRDAGRGLHAAHAAGLVHRDFKPANVLVGRDDRVRVMDFGLARQTDAPHPSEPVEGSWPRDGHSSLVSTELTHAGVIVGTLAYMAPEQFKGPADARSDQFSFCVALYQTLYGERPFDKDAHSTGNWKVHAAPVQTRVPGWIRAVLLRGLSVNPSDRYPSMEALVHALGNNPHRRRWALAAAASLLLVAALAVGARQTSVRGAMCGGAQARLSGVWDASRKERIQQTFAATGRANAQETWQRLVGVLDPYADAWVRMHTAACEATRVRGEQSDEVLSLRMECLDRRLQGLRSLTDALGTADVATMDASVRAASALADLEGCAQISQLMARVKPPGTADAEQKVSTLKRRIADARAALDLAQYARGLEQATAIVEDARRVGYRPLEAEALELQGTLQERTGKSDDAHSSFYDSLCAAQAGGDDVGVALASSRLSRLEFVRANYASAIRWGRYTEAALERVGGDPKIEGAQRMVLGLVAVAENRIDEGVKLCERALALRVQAFGPQHPEVAESYNSLGRALYFAARDLEAMAPLTRALEIWERTLGPHHPETAQAHHNVANTLEQLGRMEESLHHHLRALAIRRAVLDAEHPDIASSLGRMSALKARLGRPKEALADIEQAVRISIKIYGLNHPLSAENLRSQGYIQKANGQFVESVESYQRSLSALETIHGEKHPRVGLAMTYLGNALEDVGRMREALAYKQRAVAIIESAPQSHQESLARAVDALGGWYQRSGQPLKALTHYERTLSLVEQVYGPTSPMINIHVAQVASALLDAKAPGRALAYLERALVLSPPEQSQPGHRGEIKFLLARALWETNGDKARALDLAHQAREDLSQSPYADKQAALETWLTAHAPAGAGTTAVVRRPQPTGH